MELTRFTKNMQNMLPQWMKMAKDPESVGAQFLDAFGFEFEDIERYMHHCLENQFIGTANIGDIDFCYKVPLALPKVADFSQLRIQASILLEGVRVPLMQVDSLKHFYESDDLVCILDREEGYLYVSVPDDMKERGIFHPFDAIDVDSTLHYDYSIHHIWNVFDEFALLVGISRLPGERNAGFKERILDVFRKPGNSTTQGMLNALSRELGVSKDEIVVGSLANPTYMNTLMNPDGTPSKKLMDYVDSINKSLGFTWDNMNWGDAYWRSLEESNMGFYYLPHIWDGFSPLWKDHEIQSGVGSGDDLLVTAPKEEESTRNFKAYVGLRGTVPNAETLYPEMRFKYKIVAKGKVPNEEYKIEDYKYSIISSEIIHLSYLLTATKNFLYQSQVNWIDHAYVFADMNNPSMEIVTGEDVLHKQTDPYVKLHVEMATSDRTKTPSLQELTIQWEDKTGSMNDLVLSTDADFTQTGAAINTNFVDTFATTTGEVELGFGDFYAVVDTEGAFMKGTRDMSVIVQKDGSITLDI